MNGPSTNSRTAVIVRYLALVLTLPLAGSPAHGQTVLYVDQNATGSTHDGWTWCTAFTDLQDALDVAYWDVIIRVAEGTYTPDRGTGDRTATFRLTTNVAIKGGYAGCGADNPDARDFVAYETILSGDLNGDDVPVKCTVDSPDCDSFGGRCINGICITHQGNSENSYHVVTGSGTNETAVFDGFTITGGNADGSGNDGYGGAMYNLGGGSRPMIANCVFRRNSARSGAGMYNGNSHPTLTNCTFEGNMAQGDGGGMHNANSSDPTFANCTFTGNSANGYGGGMYNYNSSDPRLTACAFISNSANQGGGMTNNSSHPVLTNCVFIGNSAEVHGGGMHNTSGEPTLANCLFSGNSAVNRGGGMYSSSNSDATLTNCSFSANSAAHGQGVESSSSTVRITGSILWDGASEVHGSARITYSNVYGGWPGEGNFFAIPIFEDADGDDGIPGTEDDNLHLLPGSPCIDRGDPEYDPGSTTVDLDGNVRVVDGDGDRAAIVDMGAYEYQPGDFDGDYDVDLDDFTVLAGCMAGPGVSTPPGGCTQDQFDITDVDRDDDVDLNDYAMLQTGFPGEAR